MSAPNLSGLLAGGDADVVWDFNQGAMFSGDRTYRWKLWRRWDPDKPELAVIGLNPSTADETNDDATVRRCLGFARDWGYGRLLMLNLFPYRAKSPITLAGWYSDRAQSGAGRQRPGRPFAGAPGRPQMRRHGR